MTRARQLRLFAPFEDEQDACDRALGRWWRRGIYRPVVEVVVVGGVL